MLIFHRQPSCCKSLMSGSFRPLFFSGRARLRSLRYTGFPGVYVSRARENLLSSTGVVTPLKSSMVGNIERCGDTDFMLLASIASSIPGWAAARLSDTHASIAT